MVRIRTLRTYTYTTLQVDPSGPIASAIIGKIILTIYFIRKEMRFSKSDLWGLEAMEWQWHMPTWHSVIIGVVIKSKPKIYIYAILYIRCSLV